MRIFYLASDIDLASGHGGSTHVREVAENLASLGHDVHVFARGRQHRGNPCYHATPRLIPRFARFMNRFVIGQKCEGKRPHVVLERYYNFGGEGAWLARAGGVPFVLEANSPMIEYPGSPKERIDRLLIIKPLRRYREWLAGQASLIVTPLPSILPPLLDPAKVLRLPWGANTDRFAISGKRLDMRKQLGIPADSSVALFAGSFRRWHGATTFAEVALELIQGPLPQLRLLFVGDGETLADVKALARRSPGNFIVAGRVPYDQMPAYMEAADFAVAPFDTAAHPHLQLGFYWSPLKIFEAMAMSLPVLTIARPELDQILADCGVSYAEGDRGGLASAVVRLASDPDLRGRLGSAARARVAQYSWRAHCEALSERLERLITGDKGPERVPASEAS